MNKVALVTGGATGIGRASAAQLSDMRYDILISYNTSSARAEEFQEELEAKAAILRK